jgi:hypothetical protein
MVEVKKQTYWTVARCPEKPGCEVVVVSKYGKYKK